MALQRPRQAPELGLGMNARWYKFEIRMRSKTGKRQVAVRTISQWANSPEEAFAKARDRLIEEVDITMKYRS